MADQRVLRIAAEIFAAQDTREADAIERLYQGDITHTAPYPCGDAAIFNRRSEILLIQRKDDRLWAMPGGGFEVGETPAEAALRLGNCARNSRSSMLLLSARWRRDCTRARR